MAGVTENSLLYLNNIANILPKCQASDILKSHYFNKCRLLEIRENVICSKALRCPKCYSYSTDELRMCHIQPECKFPRFTKRLLLKCAKGDLLTKLQNKYRRKIKQLSRNKLVSICNICKTEMKQNLPKPKKVIDSVSSEPHIKKKKKKKDKFVGLNKQAVLSTKNNANKPATLNPSTNDKSVKFVPLSRSSVKSTVNIQGKNKHIEQAKRKKDGKKLDNRLHKVNSILNKNESNVNSLKLFLQNL